MNKHLAKYEDKRIETNLVLKDILKFYNDNGYVAEATIINDFIDMLQKEEFSIVIVGEVVNSSIFDFNLIF